MIEAISSSINPVKCSKKGNVYQGTNSSKVIFPVAGLIFAAPALKDVYKSSKETKIANVIMAGLQVALVNIGIGAIVDGIFNANRAKGADVAMETVAEIAKINQASDEQDCTCPECIDDDCACPECDKELVKEFEDIEE